MAASLDITTTVDTAQLDAMIARVEHLDAIVAKYAALIEARAKQLVPVLTGALRDSITTHLEGLAAEIVAGEGLDYAAIIEYGGYNRPAKPYIRPATEEYVAAFVAEIWAAMGG
jgi:HK97 gp10 family phage protein